MKLSKYNMEKRFQQTHLIALSNKDSVRPLRSRFEVNYAIEGRVRLGPDSNITVRGKKKAGTAHKVDLTTETVYFQ